MLERSVAADMPYLLSICCASCRMLRLLVAPFPTTWSAGRPQARGLAGAPCICDRGETPPQADVLPAKPEISTVRAGARRRLVDRSQDRSNLCAARAQGRRGAAAPAGGPGARGPAAAGHAAAERRAGLRGRGRRRGARLGGRGRGRAPAGRGRVRGHGPGAAAAAVAQPRAAALATRCAPPPCRVGVPGSWATGAALGPLRPGARRAGTASRAPATRSRAWGRGLRVTHGVRAKRLLVS
jgi:hypothetical protein